MNQLLSGSLSSELNFDVPNHPLTTLVLRRRGLILRFVKNKLWQEAIKTVLEANPRYQQHGLVLKFKRILALQQAAAGRVDREFEWTVFAQLFRQIGHLEGSFFRRGLHCSNQPMFKVDLVGENAVDQGGPYREIFTAVANELMSPTGVLLLFVRTANARGAIGSGRDIFVPNPAARDTRALSRLMGAAILPGGALLALSLPSLLWKGLLGEEGDETDLMEIDLGLLTSLRALRDCPPAMAETGQFELVYGTVYTVTSADPSSTEDVPLLPGGERRDVT